MKIYGPYERKDGRKHVIHYDLNTRNRRTQSYPRYLMEQHLGRELESWEHIDHINDDCTDDRIENLQILTLAENNRKSARPAEIGSYICPECNKTFSKSAAIVRHNQGVYKKFGPFCSRRCAGKYSARLA